MSIVNNTTRKLDSLRVNDAGELLVAGIAEGGTGGGLEAAEYVGALSQFNRIGGGPIVQYTLIDADEGPGIQGPCIFYGLICITAGTVVVYDNVAASGQIVLPSKALAVGDKWDFGGVGVLMNNGFFCDITAGTYLALYVPGA
jgi:hypothetical protein